MGLEGDEVQTALDQAVAKEVSLGYYAIGPFSETEMNLKYSSLTRRFTLAQGVEEYEVTNANGEKVLDYRPKVRCIDDFSESGVNGTAILRERINPDGVDSIIAMARTWGGMVNGTIVSLKLDDGEVKTGTAHQSLCGDRLAVALNALSTLVLEVPTSQYFDDYAFVLPAAMECFGGYFDKFAELLGWFD
eukprot:221931-Amphidinium_carterae.1